jgi:hypothetical protein
LEHGNGLFITETSLPKQIEELFLLLGKVKIDSEDCLTQVNKLATCLAVKIAIEIETEFAKRGFLAVSLKAPIYGQIGAFTVKLNRNVCLF